MSKFISCVPVVKPVPTKNNANPKFLKIFRHCLESLFEMWALFTMSPIINPTISVLAVVPKQMLKNAIFMLPKKFPNSAVMQSNISSGYILLLISVDTSI